MDLAILLRCWNYEEAKEFYVKHGDNQTVIRMLSGVKNSYIEKRLRQEIQKLTQSTAYQKDYQENYQETVHPKVSTNSPYFAQKLTPEVFEIASRWKRNYKKASRLQMSLEKTESDEERKKMAFEILELMDLVYDDWDNLAYYEEHGSLLPTQIKVELSSFDKADLMQRLRTLRTYLSPSKSSIYSEEKCLLFRAEISEIEKTLIGIDTN